MLTKKALLTGLTIAALASPGLTLAATLDVYNETNEDNTVRIVQSGLCSSIGGHITHPHTASHTDQFKVKMLCLLAKKCDAIMFADNNCSSDKPVAKPVAHLSLDTTTLTTTLVSLDDPNYQVIVNKNRVDIRYAPNHALSK